MITPTNRKLIILLVVCALISSSAFFFFPDYAAIGATPGLSMVFAAGLTQVLAVYYFLSSMRTFKKDLRVAFYLVAAGLFIFSFLQLAPTFLIYVTIQNLFVLNALYFVPYALGGVFMFLGARQFAKLLDIHERWLTFWPVLAVALIAGIVTVLVPHPQHDGLSEKTLDFALGPVAWCGIFSLATAWQALHIRKVISSLYKSAMLWFALASSALTLTAYHEMIFKLFLQPSRYVGNYSLWVFTLTGILFLKAGLAFKDAGRQFVHLAPDASYVDVVINMAQLVSKPSAVDSALDRIRAITARGSTAQLSVADKATIVEVYRYIEDYLLTKEPLQTFTLEGLRADLPEEFRASLGQPSAV